MATIRDQATSAIAVLLVEDSEIFARVLKQALAETDFADFEITHAVSLAQAEARLGEAPFDVLLLDLSLPDSRGMRTLDAVHAASPQTPIVVLTASDDEMLGREAVRRGAQDFLIKGQADDRLVARAIRYAIERREILQERDRLIGELQSALDRVKQLSGLLPICSNCKKVRDDRGYWSQIESYIREHSEAEFSHGLCPECAAKLYPEIFSEEEA
ncbi:MAG: response regulator [Planctomycetes bacterium]|nr:response regulator [Planctomycetota bacterium]